MNWRLPIKRPPGEPFDWYVLWQTEDGVYHVAPRATLADALVLKKFLLDSCIHFQRCLKFNEFTPPDIDISRIVINKFK